jgi:CheY-like chemotaxis protein
MTALLVLFMIVAFLVVDLLVRAAAKRMEERRLMREREAALGTAVRLDFTHESPSLKRVEVPNPKARILAVDDEAIVLDSFRKILVLDGFNVDTVESGQEALGLVQRNDYDFVFTDLKMPAMDGVEVVKGVKHLRPDVDVAVITGYGTIETAVETMQHGAADYVQKPFTADELTEFARKLLVRRQARLETQRKPTVRIMAPALANLARSHEYCVPGGFFVASSHVWMRIEPGGQVRLGLDDLARKALGPIDAVELPKQETDIAAGEPLFMVKRGDRTITFPSPLGGRVLSVNGNLRAEPMRLVESPYEKGWICLQQPADLAESLKGMRIGQQVVAWYPQEVERLRQLDGAAGRGTLPVDWAMFEKEFLARAGGRTTAPVTVG